MFPSTCVDRLTCWIKLNCSIKALNFAAFTSAGSLIRKLKSPIITCLPDKESSTPVSSLNWSLKSDENVPLGTYTVVTWRVFVPCWSETVWCSNVVYFPVLICFALYVSRKTRATPPPRVGLSVWMTEYPAGVIWPRLTVELLLHQVSVSARKSRLLSTISSYIESSLLLIERQFKDAHLVPVVDLTLEVCSSYWHGVDGCHSLYLKRVFLSDRGACDPCWDYS